MPMSRRLNREWPCEAKGIGLQFFSHRVNYPCAPIWAREDSGNWQGPAIQVIPTALVRVVVKLIVTISRIVTTSYN